MESRGPAVEFREDRRGALRATCAGMRWLLAVSISLAGCTSMTWGDLDVRPTDATIHVGAMQRFEEAMRNEENPIQLLLPAVEIVAAMKVGREP